MTAVTTVGAADTTAAAERGHASPRGGGARGWVLVREVLVILAGVLTYFGVRGLTEADAGEAVRNAMRVVALEERLDLDVERGLQATFGSQDAVTTVMNWIYIWGHWPVIGATLLFLALQHPARYRITRDAMLISGGVGLVVFVSFPVAPPRLAGLGFVDTVTSYSHAYRVLQPPAFVNQYAAVPSLHVGWDLLMGIALFAVLGSWRLRWVGVALPLLMVSAVVLTANHYLVDAVAGAALVLASLALARGLEGRRAAGAERAPVAAPLVSAEPPAPPPASAAPSAVRRPAPRLPRPRAGVDDSGEPRLARGRERCFDQVS